MQGDGRLARRLVRTVASAMLSVVWLILVPVNGQAQSTLPQASDPSPTLSDQKLDAVATALEHVAAIRGDYQQKIQQAAPADRERIADEGNTALAKAITEQGLSLDEYSSILVVAQNDPVVREKILQRIKPPAK
jgi:hypothetical protein